MAMKGEEAYALSTGYTDDSIRGIDGVLAGKNCVIKEIVDNEVTFEWTADDGVKRTGKMTVEATIPEDQVEEEVNAWLEEHGEELKGKDGVDGKGVQVLDENETESDIKDETVLAFKYVEGISDESYTKSQSDARYAKAMDVGNKNMLIVNTWTDLVDAINDTFGKGMGGYKIECDEFQKTLTLIARNGSTIPMDISQIILNTNIEELKNILISNILDGQSLVWNASKKKWVNKSIDSNGVLTEAKKYTDDEIAKFNKKGSILVDEKPTYYDGIITYKRGGVTETTDNANTWFYYFDENSKAVQTIFIEGTEFTITMSSDIELENYVANTDVVNSAEGLIDRSKIPNLKAIDEIVETINDNLGEKVNTIDIEDNLASDATDKPLSAKQGKELNSKKLDNTTDVENGGKALVVDEYGNIVFGDAGVKVSLEEGNKITEKEDGIFVASEIDDSETSEETTWSSKKINEEIASGGGGTSIDDATTSTDSTWSSQKISETTGRLGNLMTLNKSNLVSAINEIAWNVGTTRFLYRYGEDLCNYDTMHGIKYASTIEINNDNDYNVVYATKSIDLSSYNYITFIGRCKSGSSWKDINVAPLNIKSYDGRYFVNLCLYKGSSYVRPSIYFGFTDKVTKTGSMSSIKIYEESGISAVRIDQIYLGN